MQWFFIWIQNGLLMVLKFLDNRPQHHRVKVRTEDFHGFCSKVNALLHFVLDFKN